MATKELNDLYLAVLKGKAKETVCRIDTIAFEDARWLCRKLELDRFYHVRIELFTDDSGSITYGLDSNDMLVFRHLTY